MTQTPIRTAILGAGYIADWHAEALKLTPGVELVAVCDVSKSSANAFAQAYDVKAFNDLDEMIAAKVCDAVHILTPPDSHAKLAEACLQGGLHCFVEKPVALGHAETQQIVKVSEEEGKTFAAGHNFMGLPSYERLKAAVTGGDLGRITSAEVNWHFPLAPLRSGPFGMWMLREPKNLLLELGPHLFAFAVDLFGELEIEHLSLGKPIALPADPNTRPQSWRIIARAGDVDVTLNLSIVETMDDRSVTVRGSTAQARLNYAQDTLTFERENASDIVLNPLRKQVALAGQNLREGMVNAARQVGSLNRKSAYGLSFQGAFKAFYQSLNTQQPMDSRFDGAAAETVMKAIDDTLALLPKQKPALKKPKGTPKPSVLVIGGTGFIGRALTHALVGRGKDVRVLSRGRSGPFDDIADQVELFSAPLTDPEALDRAMEGIEAVYHLGKSMDTTWEDCLKNDVGVTVGIAEAALRAGVDRFVYTGTIASYDMSDPEVTITEDTGFAENMSDRNLYARSKAKCEHELEMMRHSKGLPLVIARPGIVVGAGGPLQHWGIGRWHGAGAVRIWGPGSNILPFVLIDDVAEALVRMMEEETAVGESFNLVADPMMSARDYFAAIHAQLGAKIAVSSGNLTAFWMADAVKYALKRYALRRHGAIRPSLADWKSRAHFSPFDNRRTKELLGWSPVSSKSDFIQTAIKEANLLGF